MLLDSEEMDFIDVDERLEADFEEFQKEMQSKSVNFVDQLADKKDKAL